MSNTRHLCEPGTSQRRWDDWNPPKWARKEMKRHRRGNTQDRASLAGLRSLLAALREGISR